MDDRQSWRGTGVMGPDREATVLNALHNCRVRPKKALAGFLSAALRTMGSFLACRNVLLSGALPMGEGRETHSFYLARAAERPAFAMCRLAVSPGGQSQKSFKNLSMIFSYRRFFM